jgi:hypothetical protein
MSLRVPHAFLFCSLAVALTGCGSEEPAGGLAGNVEVGFFYEMPTTLPTFASASIGRLRC